MLDGVGLPFKFFRSRFGVMGDHDSSWPNITESVTFPTCFCFALEKHQEEFNVISPLPIDIKLNHNETDDALMEPRRWDKGEHKKSLRPHAKCSSLLGMLEDRVKTCENM